MLTADRRLKGTIVSMGSILLVDDNSDVLEKVREILDEEYQIVSALKDGPSVLRDWRRLRADVIVLDISLGELNGIDVARELRDSGCVSKIVFLTVHEDPDFVKAAFGAGGSGYVVKRRLVTDLIPAIHAVLDNKLFVSATLLYQGA